MYIQLKVLISILIFVASGVAFSEPARNIASSKSVNASSVRGGYTAEKAVDGLFSNESRWLSDDSNGPHVLEIDLGKKVDIGCIQVITGWVNYGKWISQVNNFKIQFHKDGQWEDDKIAQRFDNKSSGVEILFPEAIAADKIRFVSKDKGPVRVVEIRVFQWGQEYPEVFELAKKVFTEHPVFVNLSGYSLDWPKRFTAPLAQGKSSFVITKKDSEKVLYRGQVNKGLGDFSDFKPKQRGVEYVITVSGGDLETGTSDPFQIEPGWMQEVMLEPAVRFMQDARSVVGTHPSAFGGSPWRDGTYYSYEMPSLVLLYLAGKPAIDKLPIETDYQEEKNRIMDPGFKLVRDVHDKDILQSARRYYTELDGPVGKNVPDAIKSIHWGVGMYLVDPQTHDPSGDPLGNRIHAQTVAQFAYFLYGYPAYEQYFTDNFYNQVYDFAFEQWDKVGLFDVIKKIGTFKGRHCPGYSIMPNLMMYEVAKRHGRSDAERFLKAAQKQTQWVIDDLDWNDPITTKGQRMSEHMLMTGLVFFLTNYVDQAPAGLQNKVDQWADIMIARSDNMWDLRRYDENDWSLPRFSPGAHGGSGWNDPGNLAGFPALCFAVSTVTKDIAKKQRLIEVGVAHFDNLFGRNPFGVHSGNRGPIDFKGVERGWPKEYQKNVCARLELVRGTLSSSCNTEHYPFNPIPKYRHPEGWVAHNAAFNVGIAYAIDMNGPKVEDKPNK
jgi:hypothetical protein